MKIVLRSLRQNNIASAIPIIYFILTLVVCGALFSLLFIEVGFPLFLGYIPDSDSKTFILMMLRGIPLIVLLMGVICLIREGMKKEAF